MYYQLPEIQFVISIQLCVICIVNYPLYASYKKSYVVNNLKNNCL
jgi:hypothetical protein